MTETQQTPQKHVLARKTWAGPRDPPV